MKPANNEQLQLFIDRAVHASSFDRDACCGTLWLNLRLSTVACERIADYIIGDRDTILAFMRTQDGELRFPELNALPKFPFTYGFYGEGIVIVPHLVERS